MLQGELKGKLMKQQEAETKKKKRKKKKNLNVGKKELEEHFQKLCTEEEQVSQLGLPADIPPIGDTEWIGVCSACLVG